MQLLGGNPVAQASAADRLPGVVNYFLGNDPSRWQTHIPTYARVQYQDIYPGIGLVYYGNEQQLEYDLRVAPGANPGQIRLAFVGAQTANVDAAGELVVQAGGRVLRQQPPVAYQEVAGERREVAVGFVVQGLQVSFALGDYDRSLPLVIDPALAYSTYLGGSSYDVGNAIAVDASGDAFVTGLARSSDFPLVKPLQSTLGGFRNAFVVEVTPGGSALAYSTFLGGNSTDLGSGIAVDADGDVFVAGAKGSLNFPQVNPLQQAYGGGGFDAFVAEFMPDGLGLVFSSYLGGSAIDAALGIASDPASNAYVIGQTISHNFPTVNPVQPAFGGGTYDAFVAKIS
jgi:hypothetical protein